MSKVNPQAESLNTKLSALNPMLLNVLSQRGKAVFFPEAGIMAQSGAAKGKRYNATIGIAKDEDGTPMCLPSIAKLVDLDPTDIFPYAPSFGKPELRTTWRGMIYKKNPSLTTEISQPVVTNALTHGLSTLGYLFLDKDDTLFVTDKFWGNYKLTYNIGCQANIQTFNTFTKTGLDIEALKNTLENHTGKTILILNLPNNPAGYAPTMEEAHSLKEVLTAHAVRGNETVVILDDAYFGLVFEEGIYKESLFTLLANAHENLLAVKLDGATKEDYVWGLRVGFLTYGIKNGTKELYEILENKTAGAVRGTVSNAPHISQSLLLKAYTSEAYTQEKEEKYNLMKNRYLKVKEILQDSKFSEICTPLPYNSGYFMCIEMHEGIDANNVRETLLEKYDTGVISIGNMIRIAYSCCAIHDLPQLFENIYQASIEVKTVNTVSRS